MGYRIIQEGSLAHYGVLGMKWGVRRYQNADGSLTAAGKKRYSNGQLTRDERKKQWHVNRITTRTNRDIAKARADRDALMSQRGQLQARIDKGDIPKVVRILNAYGIRGLSNEQIAADFREGTRLMQAGFDRYETTARNYADMRLRRLETGTKESNDFRTGMAYLNQKISDASYGRTYTVMSYASRIAYEEKRANKK